MAFKDRRAVLTTDYLTDDRFDHSKEIDAFIKRMRIRAVMSTPLMGEDGPIGDHLGRVAQRRRTTTSRT